jgi:DNA-binding MarR family transcriptional regulator
MKRSKPEPAQHGPGQHGPARAVPLTGQMMHAWFRFGQALKREIVPMLEKHHSADFFDFMVLRCIESGGIYPGNIAETLVVQPSQISRTLEGLVKRNLVKRSLDAEDSRRVRLELTSEGHKVLGEVYVTTRAILEPSFEQIGHEQVHDMIQVIERLTHSISNRASHLEHNDGLESAPQEVSR